MIYLVMLSTGYGESHRNNPVKAFVPSEFGMEDHGGRERAEAEAQKFAVDESDRLLEVKKKWDKVDAGLTAWSTLNSRLFRGLSET